LALLTLFSLHAVFFFCSFTQIFGFTYIKEDQQGSKSVTNKEYVFGVTFEQMDNGQNEKWRVLLIQCEKLKLCISKANTVHDEEEKILKKKYENAKVKVDILKQKREDLHESREEEERTSQLSRTLSHGRERKTISKSKQTLEKDNLNDLEDLEDLDDDLEMLKKLNMEIVVAEREMKKAAKGTESKMYFGQRWHHLIMLNKIANNDDHDLLERVDILGGLLVGKLWISAAV